MRRRVLLLACALGVVSVMGVAPQAQASCHSYTIGDVHTGCIENVVCSAVNRVRPTACVD
jgi:hypothetical protein